MSGLHRIKVCTMNCGPSALDKRSAAQLKQECEECIWEVLRPAAIDWRTAIDEALVSSGLDCLGPSDEPAPSLRRLLDWEILMALDPKVSSAAQNLVELGRSQAHPVVQMLRELVDKGGLFPDLHAKAVKVLHDYDQG